MDLFIHPSWPALPEGPKPLTEIFLTLPLRELLRRRRRRRAIIILCFTPVKSLDIWGKKDLNPGFLVPRTRKPSSITLAFLLSHQDSHSGYLEGRTGGKSVVSTLSGLRDGDDRKANSLISSLDLVLFLNFVFNYRLRRTLRGCSESRFSSSGCRRCARKCSVFVSDH